MNKSDSKESFPKDSVDETLPKKYRTEEEEESLSTSPKDTNIPSPESPPISTNISNGSDQTTFPKESVGEKMEEPPSPSDTNKYNEISTAAVETHRPFLPTLLTMPKMLQSKKNQIAAPASNKSVLQKATKIPQNQKTRATLATMKEKQ